MSTKITRKLRDLTVISKKEKDLIIQEFSVNLMIRLTEKGMSSCLIKKMALKLDIYFYNMQIN